MRLRAASNEARFADRYLVTAVRRLGAVEEPTCPSL
jgi:hypothetical protein